MYALGDVRVEERENPTIIEPTDAIIRLTASCICGSDLWPYRGLEPVDHSPMGHEYVGTVAEIGSAVKNIKVGDFVVGSFFASDNTCEICQAGYPSRCVHAELMGAIGTQAEFARVPLADGTLVATPGQPAFSASWPPSSWAPSGSSPCPVTPIGRRSPASSEPQTSSKSAVMPGSRRSRSSPAGSARTP
jgi:threonine dehydrogenase-like Zn-dependent dehydrogenase